MMKRRNNITLEDFLAKNGYADSTIEAARAHSLVWELAQAILRHTPPESMTIAGLSQALTESAMQTLGMAEDELVRLLRSHRPH